MTAWPDTLPASPLTEGFRETAPDTVIRTSMDQGPAKLRRRTTAGVGALSLTYLLNRTQVDALMMFYNDTVAGGALSFTFAHPVSGDTLTCRFRQMPAYAPVNAIYFRAGIELEVLP